MNSSWARALDNGGGCGGFGAIAVVSYVKFSVPGRICWAGFYLFT